MAETKPVVVVIEDADWNVSDPALDSLRQWGYPIKVLRNVSEAMEQLLRLAPHEVVALLTDLYLKEPQLPDWVRGGKADRAGEVAAGGPFAIRAANACIPVAIVTAEAHGRNPFLFAFGPAHRIHIVSREPAWIILLEAESCCIKGLRYVPALKGKRMPGTATPFDGICRVEELPPQDPCWLATLKCIRACLQRWRSTRWAVHLLNRRPAWLRPSVYLKRLLQHSAKARKAANFFQVHRLVRRATRYAAYNPKRYGEDKAGAYLGEFAAEKTHAIKDWGAALGERLRTPVPTRAGLVCETRELRREDWG